MPQKRNIQSSESSAQAFGHISPQKYSIWQNDNRKIWLALILLIAGLILTCAAALYVKRGVESIARKEFDFACTEIKNRISIRLQQHAQILRSASAFYEVDGKITRERWHSAIARQNIEQFLPGIQGIGFAIIIPPDKLASHERKIRNEGFPQYAVKPTGKRDIYTSIIYLEPFSERNLRAFGYDMFSEPIRRKAMAQARDFDEATLSGKITLVQETDKDIQAGTLMYVPVYERGLPVRSIEERRRAIRGWVYSPYRMNDLMLGILGAWELGEGRQIRLEVFDDTSFQSEALLYDSKPGKKHELTAATIFNEQTSILFKNHRWSLRFTQIGDRTGIVDYSKAWYVLTGGTLVSVLLFTLYFLLINAVDRAHKLAEALTRELRESTERKRAEEELQRTLESLRKSFGATVQVLVSAVESRDPYTAGHQIRAADLARAIATEMELPQEKIGGIRMAGAIHDIGKISVPAEILSKPTKLSELEFAMIKEHAQKGFEMLKDVESPWPLAQIVYQHHERMDGSGYPRNLKGEEIMMEARILTVADVVEAMASHRPYRPGLGLNVALAEIENHKGTLYDKDAVDACLRLFREKGFQLEGT